MSIIDKIKTLEVFIKDLYGNPDVVEYVRKSDVVEALTKPTDEQVEALTAVAWEAINEWRPAHEDQWERVVRAVLAAAAGGGR